MSKSLESVNEYTWHQGHAPENAEISDEYLVFFLVPNGDGSGWVYREVLLWDGEKKCWENIGENWIILATLKIPRLHQITFETGAE